MAINRLAGLVLPSSTKFLIDDVVGKHRTSLLTPLILAVVAATVIQGITSFSLTQLLSKAAQRLIADMRREVQQHIGRLPLAYYDANKTGRAGVAHHERRRRRAQPDWHGAGGVCRRTAERLPGGRAAVPHQLQHDGPGAGHYRGVCVWVAQDLRRAAADLPRPRQDQRRSLRAAHRIAGRRAGGERLSCGEARSRRVFRRRAAAARQCHEDPHRDVAHHLERDGADGSGGRGGDVHRGAPDLRGHAHARGPDDVHGAAGVPAGAGVPGGGHRNPDYRSSGRPGTDSRGSERKAGGRRSAARRGARRNSGPRRVPERDLRLRQGPGRAARTSVSRPNPARSPRWWGPRVRASPRSSA